MNHSKERRRAKRANRFGTHEADPAYRAVREEEHGAENSRAGREWDSESAIKADERELESVDRVETIDRDDSDPR